MNLLMHMRRYWAIFVLAVLFLPMIGLLFPNAFPSVRSTKGPEERWWLRAVDRMDPYINDTFGFRGAVLAAHNTYGYWLGGGGTHQVLIGKDGALFYKKDQATEISAGTVLRPESVNDFADMMQKLDAEMKARGGTFVVAIAPNAHTINSDKLPDRIRSSMKDVTEYDLIAAALKERGVRFADLRPALEAAKARGPVYYNNDTHWNYLGGLVGFNETMTAAGRPDLAYAPDEVVGDYFVKSGGDLLPMLGISKGYAPDQDINFKGRLAVQPTLEPMTNITTLPNKWNNTRALKTGHEGPRIMVLGDSFTSRYWDKMLADRSSAYVWTHHRHCKFNRDVLNKFKPDILIYVPTERFAYCMK